MTKRVEELEQYLKNLSGSVEDLTARLELLEKGLKQRPQKN